MIVRKEIDPTQSLTPSQIEMLHNLESRPISPDEDCPELTMEQLTQFRRISAASPQTGKGPRQGIYFRSQSNPRKCP